MKKLLIAFILLVVCSAQGQTDEKENLERINRNVLALYESQNFDEALILAQKALELSLKIYGAEKPETATTYKNLGVLYQEKSKYKESIESLQKAVDIYQTNSNTNTNDLIMSCQILAYSQFLNGKKTEAEANYLKGIKIAEDTFGNESKESFMPLLNTANFYARVENYEEAVDFYIKSFRLGKKYFGEESREFESIHIYLRLIPRNPISDSAFKKKYAEIIGYEIGKAKSLPIPIYPGPLTTQRKIGKVIVKVLVDEEGNVKDAKMVWGNPFFQPAVETAAKKSKFKPAIKNGNPVQAVDYIVYNF